MKKDNYAANAFRDRIEADYVGDLPPDPECPWCHAAPKRQSIDGSVVWCPNPSCPERPVCRANSMPSARLMWRATWRSVPLAFGG